MPKAVRCIKRAAFFVDRRGTPAECALDFGYRNPATSYSPSPGIAIVALCAPLQFQPSWCVAAFILPEFVNYVFFNLRNLLYLIAFISLNRPQGALDFDSKYNVAHWSG